MLIRSLLLHPFTMNVDVKDFQRPGVPVAGTRFIYGAPLFLWRGDTETPIKLRGWAPSFVVGLRPARHIRACIACDGCMPKQNCRGYGGMDG